MAKKKKRKNKQPIELAQTKTKKEEEKFFIDFSERQISAVLLLVLIATFLVQGVIKYLEFSNKTQFIEPWFNLIIYSLIFLLLSVFIITVSGVISILKFKRLINITSFLAFLIGFIMFLYSLIFLIRIL